MAGALLLLDTLALGYAPAGPWDAESFSLGVIGLAGIVLLYVAWYRFTFKRRGLIPWLDLWQDPAGSSQKAIIAGVATIALAWVLGNPLQEQMPDPSGLILTLIGLLMLLNGIYVKLSIGPLADSE